MEFGLVSSHRNRPVPTHSERLCARSDGGFEENLSNCWRCVWCTEDSLEAIQHRRSDGKKLMELVPVTKRWQETSPG